MEDCEVDCPSLPQADTALEVATYAFGRAKVACPK
jgi:hypothetical protein